MNVRKHVAPTALTLLFAARAWAPVWLGITAFATAFMLARIMFGARASLGIGLAVVAVSMACGTLLGLLAG